MVSTLRCGRSNPGSNPGYGKFSFYFVLAFWALISNIIIILLSLSKIKTNTGSIHNFRKKKNFLGFWKTTHAIIQQMPFPDEWKIIFRLKAIDCEECFNKDVLFPISTFDRSIPVSDTFCRLWLRKKMGKLVSEFLWSCQVRVRIFLFHHSLCNTNSTQKYNVCKRWIKIEKEKEVWENVSVVARWKLRIQTWRRRRVFQTELRHIGVLKVPKASSRVEHWSFKSFKFFWVRS